MYYYTYKITLTKGKLKDHYYYGMHTTKNLNDGYKGSGSILRDYYKKHPKDYIKEIVSFYNDFESLRIAEQLLIGDLYKTDDMCINLVAGGGNREGCNKSPCIQKGYVKTREHIDKITAKLIGRKLSKEEKETISITVKNAMNKPEVKEKCRIGGLHTLGLKWINNGKQSLRVETKYLDTYLSQGYVLGRGKIKF